MKTEARAQPIKHLLLVEELQTREELKLDAVADYAMCYAAKDGDGFAELPPVEAFDVGGDLHVINGHHRIAGALKAGAEFIRVDVVGSGTLDEARWAAASKNKANGVHRSGADKRRAIRMALDSGIGSEQSSRMIAEHVGVSKDLVGEVRAEWEAANSASIGGKANGTVTTKDGRQYPKHRHKRDTDPMSGNGQNRRGTVDDDGAPVSHRAGYESDEWYTPPKYVDAARKVLGGIDLDPASSETANHTVKAARFFDKGDDGIAQPWEGRVFLNPPFSQPLAAQFIDKLIHEIDARNVEAAIVVSNASTETKWFHKLASRCVVCFPRGRINFNRTDGESSANRYGQAFFYFGPDPARFVATFQRFGLIMEARTPSRAERAA